MVGEFRRMDVHATLPLFAAPFLLLALWKHSLGRHTDLTRSPGIAGRISRAARLVLPQGTV